MAGFGLSIRREESVHNHVTPVFTQFPCCQPDWRPWTTKLTRRRCERSWDVTVATANVRIESAKNLRRFRVACLLNSACTLRFLDISNQCENNWSWFLGSTHGGCGSFPSRREVRWSLHKNSVSTLAGHERTFAGWRED